jgi:hypothetical protein
MKKTPVEIQSFGKSGEILSHRVYQSDLAYLAGTCCFWRPVECEAQQLQATGAKLKQRIGKVLKEKALLK